MNTKIIFIQLALFLMSSLFGKAEVCENKTTFDFSSNSIQWQGSGKTYSTTQGNFTFKVDFPHDVDIKDYTHGKLKFPLNASFTITEKNGNNINMIAIDGQYNNAEAINTHNMYGNNSIGCFNCETKTPVAGYGNDFEEFGGYNRVLNFDKAAAQNKAKTIKFTYSNGNYNNLLFKKISVIDCKTISDLVDLYGSQCGFYWSITDPMVCLTYKNGILYCRSLEDSKIYTVPNQTTEKVAFSKSYNFNHSVVQVINWKYQQKHIWENKGDHFEPQFQNEYFSVPKHYSNIKYYDIDVHSLALNTTLAESPQDVPTSAEENVKNMKKIVKTSYFNLAGIESNEAFDGLNIVKTQYSDGTLKVNKIYR